MYYYNYKGANLVSLTQQEGLGAPVEPAASGRLFALVGGDPMLGRGSFKVTHPGQLANPNGLEVLDASRLPDTQVDEAVSAAIREGRLTAINQNRPGWEDLLTAAPKTGKKRVNILAIGDVGSTLLTGLKLLGGDVISSIGTVSYTHLDVYKRQSTGWEPRGRLWAGAPCGCPPSLPPWPWWPAR